MPDPILEKLDAEWDQALRLPDYVLCGKILRAKVTVLKGAGALTEHKGALSSWVKTLEDRLHDLPSQVSLTVIGHLRHARKALSITGSDVGSAFRTEISPKERARFRQRNRPPRLGVADRASLPEDFADGSIGRDLRSG